MFERDLTDRELEEIEQALTGEAFVDAAGGVAGIPLDFESLGLDEKAAQAEEESDDSIHEK